MEDNPPSTSSSTKSTDTDNEVQRNGEQEVVDPTAQGEVEVGEPPGLVETEAEVVGVSGERYLNLQTESQSSDGIVGMIKPEEGSSSSSSSSSSATILDSTYPILFKGVRGYDERRNDILYYPPDKSKSQPSLSETEIDGIDYHGEPGEKVLVFFGGDIQDLHCNMFNSKYSSYSLESTASLLHSQLPSHHILIIRPAAFKHGTYSSFDNFVPCSHNNSGIPEHTANHNALPHLELLLRETSRLFNGADAEETHEVSSTTNDLDLASGQLSLVGFSKGSVVLNQFLYEFHFYKTLHPESPPPFLSTIKHMFWLDGGHSGGKNTWITARPILDTLSRLKLSIHVHMTPYQLNDERRPYIRNEEKLFGMLLSRLGTEIDRKLWFEGEQSLEAHFALINEVFKRKL